MLTNSPFLPFPHQSNAPCTLLRRKLIYSRKSVAKLCVLFGCISVPSSAECARHAPSSEANLSSKNRRKVVRAVWVYIRSLISRVRPAHSFFGSGSILKNPSQSCACRLGVYPFPHQPSAPGTLLLRKLICSRKSIAKLRRAVWVLPARVRTTGLLLHYAASPAFAGLGCSFSDGCDTSPTETLRNLQESSSDWFAVSLTARGRHFRYMKRGRHEGPRQRHWLEPER